MKFKTDLSRQANKFIAKKGITEQEILKIFDKLLQYVEGCDINLDVSKLSGIWQGYYRIRIGKYRIIFRSNFEERIIYVKKIDTRGGIYKGKR